MSAHTLTILIHVAVGSRFQAGGVLYCISPEPSARQTARQLSSDYSATNLGETLQVDNKSRVWVVDRSRYGTAAEYEGVGTNERKAGEAFLVAFGPGQKSVVTDITVHDGRAYKTYLRNDLATTVPERIDQNLTLLDRGALGKGGQGEVLKVLCVNTAKFYVWKTFFCKGKKRVRNEKCLEPIQTKIEILSRFYPMGSLQDRRLDTRQTEGVLYQILNELRYAHQHRIVHRDIKPGNVLVGPQCHVVLSDFGIATRLEEGRCAGRMGSYPYMAPEVSNSTHYNEKVDLWRAGVTMFQTGCSIPLQADFHRYNIAGWARSWTEAIIENFQEKIVESDITTGL
ncbi:kinase-like protein [Lentithecium fluviatile CBS 122367]|uniref:Kinase-like protein n=1 Tax=Lentithecium fluviatile CBS 122367 TaxID=1168545 RepID=A0A6G1JKJ0_9PLEO|nr:kinase-like protein [Lentithecium fluviatile CBS 122367]